ncbi:recombination helicase AddA [Clostridium cellulovorans 743B]|uniref:ATP-dependent helicase/nuclease subunit A n=1 Tax=Clostridium cellulovorans (strain ATCC 35296 / DSM 3052 / OCM 3 / 743B) TaxID=573061 RepID=D9SL36_CLOC7|nr:recombination helicase AddA [Clostridium cellulovorans 743B]
MKNIGTRKWTEEQKAAIDTHGVNLLVAAAAGSGKTAVLVERIIELVSNKEAKTDIDKLLVVTFTKAAAAEMRERIGNALAEKISENPDDTHLHRQLVLLNKANITTMHSFCQSLIKNYFHKLDIDPAFRIGDATEIELLLLETIEEVLEECYKEENITIGFQRLVEGYGKNEDDKSVQDVIIRLYRFVMAMPWPESYLEKVVEAYRAFEETSPFKTSFENSEFSKEICKIVYDKVEPDLKTLRILIREVEAQESINPNLPLLIKEEAYLSNIVKNSKEGYEALRNILMSVEFGRLSTKKTSILIETKEQMKNVRDQYKETISSIIEDFFYDDIEAINEEFRFIAPIISILKEILISVIHTFKEKKRSKGIIDFNDMEHYVLELLCTKNDKDETVPTEVALEIRRKFEEIMIDEYQDSSFIQEEIMTTISRKDEAVPNMFMVGDVKQSIYKFRQAKPELFLEKYETYEELDGARNRKILLYKNFRSRKEILDGTNFIFKSIMSKELGELEYTDKEALNLGADYVTFEDESLTFAEPIDVIIFEKPSGNIEIQKDTDEDAEDLEEINEFQMEAKIIGAEIKKIMGREAGYRRKKVFDKGSYRDVEYKDIVILLRSTVNRTDVFLEELKNLEIPVYADSTSGFFDNIEVKTILALLQVIDNPKQDIPLLAVLRSPIGGFSDDELIDIKISMDKEYCYFFDKLSNYCVVGSDNDLREKTKAFLRRLNDYRSKSLHLSLVELIWFLFTDTGYLAFVGTLPNGMQRQGNLRILFHRAKQYEATSYRGLFNFINFMEKMKNTSSDLGDAKLLGENDNVVRIMTIHKSKGLEFPVVFLASTSKRFNNRELNNEFLFHHNFGIGIKYTDFEKRISYSSILRNLIQEKMKIENYSEEMRVLYVALTRAKEKLIITGGVKEIEKSIRKWALSCETQQHQENFFINSLEQCEEDDKVNSNSLIESSLEEKISKDIIIKANSYLDWIVFALMRHKSTNEIRELYNIHCSPLVLTNSPSKWNIKLLNSEDILAFKKNGALDDQMDSREQLFQKIIEEISEKDTDQYKAEIQRRLSFKYKYSVATEIPSLLSVTEIKRRFNDINQGGEDIYIPKLLKTPRFLEEEKALTSAERGTIVHLVMQHLDLNRALTMESINEQISEMIKREFINEKEAKVVDIRKILRFFSSTIGLRMLRADKIYREYPFKIRVKSNEILKLSKSDDENEDIIVQGVIDTIFVENDEIVIIDYKNDYVNDNIVDTIKTQYKTQLNYYKIAAEKILNKRVKNIYLYLFYSGEVLEYDF